MKNLLRNTTVFSLLLVAAVSALYGKFLSNPIVFDDIYLFAGDTLEKFGHSSFAFNLRWFPYATFGWSWNILGHELKWLRLENLALHAAVAVALLFFLRNLFDACLPREEGDISHGVFAFFGALLFALHPVAVFAAGYLVERSTLMATLFGLLTLLFYLKGLSNGKKRWFFVSCLCYFLSVFSKEHAVMVPAAALALTFLLHPFSRRLLKRIALPFSFFALIGILVILKAKGVLGSPYEPFASDMLKGMSDAKEKFDIANAYPMSIETQCFLFFKYLELWLMPSPAWISVDMREPFARGLLVWPQTFGVPAFLFYGGIALWLLFQRGKKGLLGFALLFPWLLFFTEFSTVRIQESFVLYRSYLWMAGFFAVLPVLFCRVSIRKAASWLFVIALAYVPVSLDRLQTFSQPLFLWDDAARLVEHRQNLPGVARIYHNRGIAFFHAYMKQNALADYDTAIRLEPGDSYAYSDRAALYYSEGNYSKAMIDFDKAIALDATVGHFFWGRGMVFEALHDSRAAENDFRKACASGEGRACDKLRKMSG